VYNTGGEDLVVIDVVPSRSEYTVTETAFTVPMGSNHPVTVTLAPAAEGSINGLLRFHSNDPVTPQLDVSLVASVPAADPPVIVVDTDTIEAFLDWGDTEARKLGVGNTGEFALNWQAQSAAAWLDLVPASGSTENGGADSITVTFDATDLGSGDYAADIVITSNDPATPSASVPTLLHVTGYSSIDLSDTVLFYDLRIVGQTQKKTLAISNLAIDPLVLDSVYVTDPDFYFAPPPDTIAYGDTHYLDVTFAPLSDGVFTGALVILSNAANRDTAVVVLQGEGVAVFSLTIPDSIAVTSGASGWETATAALTNNGSQSQPVVIDAFVAGSTPALYDNFEDLNLDGWTVVATGATKELVPGGPAPSLFAYSESNAAFGLSNGIFRTLPAAARPYEMSFWVRPGQTDLFSSYVSIRDSSGRDVIFFLALDNGMFYVNANTGGHQSHPYAAGEWYFVELRDIDWTTKSFDYYVDGELIQADIMLRNSSLVEDFARVDLFSYSAGAEAAWDNVWIAWGGHPSWLSYSPPRMTLGPGATGEIQLRTRGDGLSAGRHDAVVTIRGNTLTPTLPSFAVSLTVDSVVTGVGGVEVPAVTALHQNHPNPFNPVTTIAYDLHESSKTELVIYAVDGARVRTLVSRRVAAGAHTVSWDGTDERGARVASGVYFYRLTAGAYTRTRKMVALK
jgi:hypothetical protein